MIKLLIADDEPKIRRGLKSTILSMGLDIQICGEADNGKKALEIMKQASPDIILVDICMPFIDGLEFISMVNQLRSDVRFIIITGHDEFDNAHEAIKLKVFGFLLKPVDVVELHTTLQNAINDIHESRDKNQHFKWATLQIEKRREYLIEKFFCEWINSKLTDLEIKEQVEHFNLTFGEQNVLLLISNIGGVGNSIYNGRVLQLAITDALNKILCDYSPYYVFADERENIVALASMPHHQIDEFVQDAVSKLCSSLSRPVHMVALPCENIDLISETYNLLYEKYDNVRIKSPYVQLAEKYILENISDFEISLQKVAEYVNVNPTYLSRLMKQESGLSFMEYVTRTRINKAIELMQDRSVLLKTVAASVGYSNQYYFSTAFKKIVGVSPINYQKGTTK